MTNSWNPKVYNQFLEARTRPARDLLAVIPESFQLHTVYDLGCGPGNSTILLKDRWPNAKIIGIDSSTDMLKEAKDSYPNLTFIHEDIEYFSPKEEIDLLFANASLQWINSHEKLIPKLIQFLSSTGIIGIQMPNNFHAPSHQVTIQLLQSNSTWQSLIKHLCYGPLKKPQYQLSWYYDLLAASGLSNIQLWETEYTQEMSDYQGIFDWVKGTGLRPVLSEMDEENKARFKNAYIEVIAKEYPLQSNNKILMSFKRIFMLGLK